MTDQLPFHAPKPASRIWRVDWHAEWWKSKRPKTKLFAQREAAYGLARYRRAEGDDVLIRVGTVTWEEPEPAAEALRRLAKALSAHRTQYRPPASAADTLDYATEPDALDDGRD